MAKSNHKTEQIYKKIMERLILEIKEDALNEDCGEDILKQLKSVSIFYKNNKTNNLY